MSNDIEPEYDVVIMGGGPAGSTLGALLGQQSDLRVAIFEREVFPRDHIGESLAFPLIPALEESGSLPKVLASDCWVAKYGGLFHWDDATPKVTFFDHANWARDGVHRWAVHVDRPEFDHILLDHAASVGADVFQGVAVTDFHSRPNGCVITLNDGRTVSAAYFVDASGRRNSIAAKQKRSWLSGYRNIAIWQHFLGGRPAQTLPGNWNVFREPDLSPLGSFAFRDGWCWYIPVRKLINGRRTLTYSIGIVTSPEALKRRETDFTDPDTFLRTVKQVPLLKDLVQEVRPVADKMLTATNYSMVNERFADYDGRWLLIGDASYFVDPLFSSGVAFAANQARAAALVLTTTLRGGNDEQLNRDLWHDYDEGWHGMAQTYALSIDQWYHAIGKNHPDGIYWNAPNTSIDLGIQDRTFDALLNTAFTPDLLQVLTEGTRRVEDLDPTGPFVQASRMAEPTDLDPGARLTTASDVEVRRGGALDVPGFKAFIPPAPFEFPEPLKAAITDYWRDPVRNSRGVPSLLSEPLPCHRFRLGGQHDEPEVRGLDRDGAAELWRLVESGTLTMLDAQTHLPIPQQQLLKRLIRAGIVVSTQRVPAPTQTEETTEASAPIPSTSDRN